jgi:diaminopimelate decarboxylase
VKTKPAHAPHPFFQATRDDCLLVGDRTLTDVASEVGSTPFYVYSRAAIDARVAALRAALPPSVHVHYAVKANPMPAVVAHLAGLVDGLDVASAGELRIALATRTDPKDISFAGPGKRDAELADALAAGITVNVESEGELERLARIAEAAHARARVAVRVNPDFQLKSSGMKMGGGPQQFGIDAEGVPQTLARIGELPSLEFVGFHIFSGSQNLRADAIVEAQDKSLALGVELARHAPAPVQTLNIGGGFGIPYFPGEQPLDLAPIGANLARRLPEVERALPGARVVIELGRYLVGEAGLYVCRVIDRKVSRGRVFLVTDGGLHHHLAASGNFGQVLRKNYPVVVGNRVRGGAREIASVVGPLCTPLDLLADQMELARAEPGDLIAVLQSGAYGLSASPTAFLGHPPPAEVLI